MPAAAAPDEELLGKAAGYPIGSPANWFYDERVRVGSFSHLDSILPHYTLKKAASPLPLRKTSTEPKVEYRFEQQTHTLDDFLNRQRVTGFLLIKDGELLTERYQYNRNADHRLVSHSMAKSIVSLAVGMALAEKKIATLDDTIAKYVPGLAGNPYGETTIRNMLRMASGVPFQESYDGKDDLAKFNRIRLTQDSVAALRAFTTREVEQGSRFHYASNQTVALTLLLRAVTGTSVSEYLTTRLWQPMGAEADATWVRIKDGTEVGSGSFNAVLRDYGRLGILLANDGALGERRIVPKDYLLDATDWHRAARGVRTAQGDTVFRLWLPVLAVSRREAPVRAARRLRAIDFRRSRTQAGDGHYRGGEERQRGEGAARARARCAVARGRRQIRKLVSRAQHRNR
ncbi:serine hydrolase domain-containing protein [Bradyrhizobium jicamae]|nr:serine hydrolase [Bradyrhizobium jicamae]